MTSRDSANRPSKTPATPQAPRPQKVPWARRIISTLILLAVAAGVIFLLVKGAGWLGGLMTQEHAKSTAKAAPEPVVISSCQAEDLKVSLLPSASVIDEGVGLEVSVGLENIGSADCSVQTEALGIQLATVGVAASGEDEAGVTDSTPASTVIWDPSACDAEWSKTLLLRPGQSWTGNLTWNGRVYSGCDPVGEDTGGVTASAGTYTLSAQTPGSEVPQAISIQVR